MSLKWFAATKELAEWIQMWAPKLPKTKRPICTIRRLGEACNVLRLGGIGKDLEEVLGSYALSAMASFPSV